MNATYIFLKFYSAINEYSIILEQYQWASYYSLFFTKEIDI